MSTMMGGPRKPARAAFSSYVLLCVVLGIPSGAAVFASLSGLAPWLLGLAGLGALAFGILWLAAFQVQLTDEGMGCRSMFGGRKFVRYTDIRALEVRVGRATYADKFRPMVRLLVRRVASTGADPLVINLKVLAAEDVTALLDTLREKVGPIQGP